MKRLIAATTLLLATAVCSAASAQAIVYETYSPVAPVATAAPVVVQSPVVYETWRPVVRNYNYNPPVSTPNFTDYPSNYGNRGAITSYAPVVAYSPVVTETYAPVVTQTYSPVVTTTYSPVVATYTYATPVTTYYTPVVVRPRYYVPGQPVRNFFRAMGP